MNKNLKEMKLVQCKVSFDVFLDVLVKNNIDEEELKNYLVDLAVKYIDDSDDECDIIDEIEVLISKETVKKYKNKNLNVEEWKEILRESDKNVVL